ncbi:MULTISPECIES: ribose-phosphate diphosphokinase [Citrobacter]|uniref:ribose-phosphate diphosphokinase n=1 Tax=Citrobacter TaxID=544 RepID=UPI001560C4F0|nr:MULTISPECIES: ribose-phosphate diphosphokinase [Citrobacter]NRF56605.1 ribose-phosphate pyrophosphokinase [Citrobacter braakii]MCB6779327.1 ribose-phosphate diphosphokinase [Citrobacter sp. 210820-DFI.7.8]MCB6789027.1 ribose-phosphate diphosphokinase [Citrobacter sp. 210820-DFI.7.7]MCB8603459.1 ribose-phosphate diphosphokinase [Citrobacter europaeus]MCQ5006892.1 ribose-phosphate diphosphokinase [Citrobacter europaeus]
MSVKLTLTLDDQAYAVASGIFPDGAGWLKVTDALPSFARLMRIRAVAMRDMNDFMLLAQLVEAVRHQTDVLVSHLDLPWLPWARQDRHMVSGDSFALKVFASQLNTLQFDKVKVLDPHSDAAAAAIDNLVAIGQERCLLQSATLPHLFQQNALMLVAPDAGALKKIDAVARAAGVEEYAILSKKRDVASGKLTGFSLMAGDVRGRDVLIVDDLCDAGGTFIGSAQVLREAGAHSVSLYVTHGIFSKGVEHLFANGIDAIYTTTSFAAPTLEHPQLELIDIDAIYRA